MAEQTGGDILVQLLDGQRRLESRIEGVENRLDRTNDTLTLLGSVIHELTVTVKGRLEDHETRIRTIEDRSR